MNTSHSGKTKTKRTGSSFFRSSIWNWIQKGAILIVFSVVVNHLSTPESFPGGESYRFPIEGFLSTIVLVILIGIIAHFNFKYYERRYFSKKIETGTIIRFFGSTLGYITLMYIPVNLLLNTLAGSRTIVYYMLIGLLITLLLSALLIGLMYAPDLYQLYRRSIKDAEITIESGAKTTKLTYENIACFYSENKIVYTVRKDGTAITTDFTLNELEEKINDQLFFRANRQLILHKDAVNQIEKIENGKLRIQLKAPEQIDVPSEITISRYKRKAFLDWYE